MGGMLPLGYDANGRTLTVNDSEAETVRTLYDLYQEHRSIRTVTRIAAEMELRSKHRLARSGRSGRRAGGGPMGRGHIHQILTNPIYAGRIRHYKNVYDGQHAAIIAPAKWQEVQQSLAGQSGRRRGQENAAHPSALTGKLFDETGDRLSPCHSRKNGRRLRYYISHRLMQRTRDDHPDAWRLPAPQLEAAIAAAIRTQLQVPAFLPSLLPDLEATEADRLGTKLAVLAEKVSAGGILPDWCALVERATVAPGDLTIQLDVTTLADRLRLSAGRLSPEALQISAPFQLRRRGVETRIILGGSTPEPDHTLIRNIAKAVDWFEAIKRGYTFSDIAKREKTSARRIQDLIGLAFLAPDVIEKAIGGTLPPHVTTKSLIRNGVPSDWSGQRRVLTDS